MIGQVGGIARGCGGLEVQDWERYRSRRIIISLPGEGEEIG